jgi:hypothetical protein
LNFSFNARRRPRQAAAGRFHDPGFVIRMRHYYLIFAGLLIAIGLVWRLAPLGLPAFAFKYGGSILWAAMVYCFARAASPSSLVRTASLIAMLIAVAVECVKLLHEPWLDDFRATLFGALILGRIFSLWDIVAYGVGIVSAATADHLIHRRQS